MSPRPELPKTRSCQTTRSWPGIKGIKAVVIFGDSYSKVGWPDLSEPQMPTLENPLGIEFPGLTFTERGLPNWVGFFVKRYKDESPKIIYDYAIGGDNVDDMKGQIQCWLMSNLSALPDRVPWEGSDTLFVTWVGVNDMIVEGEFEPVMKRLFEYQETLYNNGARNFLIIDVPPMLRCPAFGALRSFHAEQYRKSTPEDWNVLLAAHTTEFAAAHPEVTMLFYSVHALFTRILGPPPAIQSDESPKNSPKEDDSKGISLANNPSPPTSDPFPDDQSDDVKSSRASSPAGETVAYGTNAGGPPAMEKVTTDDLSRDGPFVFGFSEQDMDRVGAIWYDGIHPTSKVHGIIAEDMCAFLECVEATE